MNNLLKSKAVGIIFAAVLFMLLLLFALRDEKTTRFMYWNIVSASNGKYRVELYSTTKENYHPLSAPLFLTSGHVELKESELHFQIHFNESRDSCKIGINEWSSNWFETPWMKEGSPNPLDAVPVEIKRNDEIIPAQFEKDPTTLVLLRKRTEAHQHLVIAIFTRE